MCRMHKCREAQGCARAAVLQRREGFCLMTDSLSWAKLAASLAAISQRQRNISSPRLQCSAPMKGTESQNPTSGAIRLRLLRPTKYWMDCATVTRSPRPRCGLAMTGGCHCEAAERLKQSRYRGISDKTAPAWRDCLASLAMTLFCYREAASRPWRSRNGAAVSHIALCGSCEVASHMPYFTRNDSVTSRPATAPTANRSTASRMPPGLRAAHLRSTRPARTISA